MEKKDKMRVPKRALVFAGSGTVDGTKIVIRASSGKPFKHPYWDKLCLDMGGMEIPKPTLPILLAHDLTKPIGSFNRDDVVVNGGLTVTGRLADVPAAREFIELVKGGIPFESSLHGVPSRIERVEEGGRTEVNGVPFEGPGSIFRAWSLREVSPCVFGMDIDTEASVFSFADAETMIDLELDGLSEDDRLVELLFSGPKHVPDEISPEDEKLANELFQASTGHHV
ncbi:MAG: hypothetical protein ABIE47_13160 [Pseudomonadota bacterium]